MDGAIQSKVVFPLLQGQIHPLTQGVLGNSATPPIRVTWYLLRDVLDISPDDWSASPLSASLYFL